MKWIRNFCIIAHVDHGKTTLSDRLLEQTQTIEKRKMQEQLLDSMDLEKEKGITIKCHPVTMHCRLQGNDYTLNLIDTPGHVDFSYEVSRSLAACEGALLLVDASQGIEAQTVANAQLALQNSLTIIPVLNKIDLPNADVEKVKQQLEDILATPSDEALLVSGKTGEGIGELLQAIVEKIPAPQGDVTELLQALIFDAIYDSYKGLICYVRVFNGSLKAGQSIVMMRQGAATQVKEVGIFTPEMQKKDELNAGDVGYVITNIKTLTEIKMGDTLTHVQRPAKEPLPGYREVKPMVFSDLYPLDTKDYERLKAGLSRLQLNDAALTFQSENSTALGFGFRCGFLGLLHMEVVQERLRREYDLDIITTYPSVVYRICLTDDTWIEVDNPLRLPDPSRIQYIEEPTIKAFLHIPSDRIGDVLSLIMEKRGECSATETLDEQKMLLTCLLPLNEILLDFNDRLKSITHGYGSMDYELSKYVRSDLVKMDILVHGETVDAFSSIVHRSKAEQQGRALCERLKDLLPKQLFKVPIQAAVFGKVIARETLSALRKDVTAKCYGGDITRKRKLLEKQKEGKKRMKQIGKVAIPQDAFVKILKSDTMH
ncbi:MAG: translation elongation factor 4 [Puniceicoccales bacterium]|jgi:GTP-binding protein LepA|nr:translation elongation factor 4 [Puniceicoccales bacterium]